MTRSEIAELIEIRHQALFQFYDQQDDRLWERGPEGKWTAGQQAYHLLQSIKPLNAALNLPKFVLRLRFGKANRAVRDYDTVVKRYHERLEASNGATFGPSRNMKIPLAKDKAYILDRLRIENKKLQYMTKRWKDKDLDTIILPHPLMGKMPVRELLMWTAYHVEHHTRSLLRDYSQL